MRLRQAIKIIKQAFRGPIRDVARAVVCRHRKSRQVARHYGFHRIRVKFSGIDEFVNYLEGNR